MFLSRCIILCILISTCSFASAQEICNNGIDDDGDGLIDLHDPECQCHFLVKDNLLENGSFESFDHCPVTYSYNDNYNIAFAWLYGTHTNDADFYHNLSCSYDSGIVMNHMPPKLPLPDGEGFISILNSAYINPVPENEMTKGYVGQCLQAPLKPGEQYTLSFYAGRFRSWDNYTGKIFPFTVALYGNADCNAVPFGKQNVLGNGCPTNYGGWVLLGDTKVASNGEWIQTKINFTVPFDISVIEIGPECPGLPPIVDLADSTTFLDYHLYYLDDIHLLPTKNFPFEYIQAEAGTGCDRNMPTLQAPVYPGATYQWYKDSIAIPGATGITYQIPGDTTKSYYNVLISAPGKCIITEPYLAEPGVLNKIDIPPDTILCTGTTLKLAPAIDSVKYNINGVENKNVSINKPGDYNIIASDNFGCQRTFSVKVVEQNCWDCELLMPNAFTPNGDGLNDVFKANLFCTVSEFNFRLFDRWGKKLFETQNIRNGWDGTYEGNKMQTGVYIYFISYKTNSNITKTAKGTVTLLR